MANLDENQPQKAHQTSGEQADIARETGKETLSGQTVVVTRAAHQADTTRAKLEELGAKAILHPVIEILAPSDCSQLDESIKGLNRFGWVVFTSTNAVRFFADRLEWLNQAVYLRGLQASGHLQIATVGPATTNELVQRLDLKPDLTPVVSNGEALASELAQVAMGQTVLIPCGSRQGPSLTDGLDAAGIEYQQPLAYISRDVSEANTGTVDAIANGKVDWVTITSPAVARASIQLFGENLKRAKLVSISPGTSKALIEAGFRPAAEATTFDIDGMIAAMKKVSSINRDLD